MSALRPVPDHLVRILSTIAPLEAVELPLLDCLGLALVGDVVAPWPLPSFDNSSMDGYAVRSQDVAGAGPDSPVKLAVLGDIAAGAISADALRPGTALRIMTGAALPVGADAVVPVEDTDGGTVSVLVRAAAKAGACIRRIGDDVALGQVVLTAGAQITARSLGVLAGVGCGTLRVHRRPRVVVVSTGDELVEAGAPLRPGLISESNGLMLTACSRAAGAIAHRAPIVPDEPAALRAALAEAAETADLIITSGGVSMGAFDTVKAVLSATGEVEFVRVAMQPGMPQGQGRLYPSGVPIITLPGNPVSSFVSFELFVRPALRRLMGHLELHRPTIEARAARAFDSVPGKTQYLRGNLDTSGAPSVQPVGGAASHLVGSLALADCLIVLPPEVTHVAAGETLSVIDLRDGRG